MYLSALFTNISIEKNLLSEPVDPIFMKLTLCLIAIWVTAQKKNKHLSLAFNQSSYSTINKNKSTNKTKTYIRISNLNPYSWLLKTKQLK